MGLLLSALGSGCASLHHPPPRPCRADAPFELAELPAPAVATHPDYRKLKPFRSYVRVDRVWPYADHFTVSYLNVEGGEAQVEVVSRPGRPPLVSIRERWTGSASPDKVAPVPVAVRPLAEAAEAALCRSVPGTSDVVVAYRGAYRELEVEEEVPYDLPARFGIPARANLRATRDLTEMLPPNGAFSALGGLADFRPRDPRWVDFAPPPELAGRCVLCAAGERGAPLPAFWPDLARGILETARAAEAGAYRSPFERLLAAQGDGLVPAEIDQVLALNLTTRAGPGTYGRLLIPLRAQEAVFDAAVGSSHAEFGERRVEVEARLAATPPAPRDQVVADRKLPMTLVLRVADGDGNEVQRTLRLTARVHLDGGRVGFLFADWDGLNTPEADKLRSLALPPIGGAPEVVVEFDDLRTPR